MTAGIGEKEAAQAGGAAALDGGTYELLRARLAEHAAELSRRAGALNERRVEAFGGTALELLGTERIRTENNCVPRDIVAVGGLGLMLFGYNVFIGLKPETTVDDVFALHTFTRDGPAFRFDPAADAAPELLADPSFRREFTELYRYYKDTRLLQLRRVEGKLLAVFQTGGRADDIKVLRWSVAADGAVSYIDNRGERDHVFPPSHDFTWTEATRDDQVLGRHPHLSILGQVFVETIGGDLTVKIENNTETGEGIYSEPVAEPLQSLADADIAYAQVGPMILLRVRPYNEERFRYLVFNTRTKEVVRADGIGQACQRLPEDQGLIFPGGFYLATGVSKTFDTPVDGLEFERVIRSPNGEDVLYVFHARAEGFSLLLPYNVIRKEVATPLPCHGYSLFDDGTMVMFRATSDEPTRVHTMQVWQTPYQSDVYAAAQPAGSGPFARVGNADLVRGISDCLSVARMVDEMAPATAVFEGLIAACRRTFDTFHWLGDQDLGDLRTPLANVANTAEQVLDEFEKVAELTAQAAAAVDESAGQIASLVRSSRALAPRDADGWVTLLADLRRQQGHLVTVRELRYADNARIDTLDTDLDEALAHAGTRAVEFLSGSDAFDSYHAEVATLIADADGIATVAQADPIRDRLAEKTDGLRVVTDIVSALDIADATVRTAILERIGEVLAGVNRARATVDGRRAELLAAEGRAEFAAEFALLGQAVTGALAAADSPDACDEQLGRLLLQVENLESRFGEFDDYARELGAKREDVYEAFSARKQTLLDDRARRADRLVESAERIVAGVRRRVDRLGSVDEVNTYFASDPMVAKLHSVVEELRAIGDTVRAEELAGRIIEARQEAGRTLRDRLEIYGADGETIRLGRHTFAVNTQAVDLTLVPHEGAMAFTVTGTDFRAAVRDDGFAATAPYWDQLVVSETAQVYRGEYLATAVLAESEPAALQEAAVTDGGLLAVVRKAAESRYDEGYERGVHDHDAAAILAALLRLHAGADLLRYPPAERAAAQLYWTFGVPDKERWTTCVGSLARARAAFGPTPAIDTLRAELAEALDQFLSRGQEVGDLASGPRDARLRRRSSTLGGGDSPTPRVEAAPGEARMRHETRTQDHLLLDAALAAEYLFEELATGEPRFVTSASARALLDRFHRVLGGARHDYEADLRALDGDLAAQHQLVHAWLSAFLAAEDGLDPADLPEAVALELCGAGLARRDLSAALTAEVEGLLGTHPRIQQRRLEIRLDELLTRCRRFREERVPGFRDYQRQRNALVEAERKRLRLSEYRPKVMSGFVRNHLLDEVYLPLIGDNLARQLGAAGDAKRTDRSGLLLLISPPGYGKTTLMEYVANRLGLVFVKVNGPALGHDVTSVDPAEAPNATARQEVEKISFALEMGNNVLLYLDDIQHTSPELLQKFISLCDAQRRMEGVWDGGTRTYDLRGKRFAVCMAGNPYTEEGKRFRVPDMLANRADVWNLGDVLSGKDELFALSFVENALTSNPVLRPLSTRDRSDIRLLVRMARGDEGVRPDQLGHAYAAAELAEILAVLRKVLRVQQVVLTNNHAYISSAATADASRTEPPFLLQGSYRNMNKLTERVVAAMNDDELERVIDDHYAGEAQTLTSAAEANLLKLAELRGRLTPDQKRRWDDVKRAYLREQALGGAEDDPMTRAVGAVGLLADRVREIRSAIENTRIRPGPDPRWSSRPER